MPINVAVPKETAYGERRVAMEPGLVAKLTQLGATILIEKDAGKASYMPDAHFKDVTIVNTCKELYQQADILLCVNMPKADDLKQLKTGSMLIGTLMPHRHSDSVNVLREQNITSFAMELIPRITRAQSMDVPSSQANIAGYKAAIMAADLASGYFPMLTTAAGTIRPAKALIIGAGVAGLQAIATVRRLGAMVSAYDVRPETKEQIKSLGAKAIELSISAVSKGGYARQLSAEEQKKQQAELATHIAKTNVLITTAAIPGRPSPKIITRAMVEAMKPGAVIVDIAAEGGGNCELTAPGETIEHNGVIIHGPMNIPSQMPVHASELYAKNLFNFLSLMLAEGECKPDWKDELIAESCLTHAGEIKHKPTRDLVAEG